MTEIENIYSIIKEEEANGSIVLRAYMNKEYLDGFYVGKTWIDRFFFCQSERAITKRLEKLIGETKKRIEKRNYPSWQIVKTL